MILSIITVHLNDFRGLQNSLESINRAPHLGEMQWLVIDGGSASVRAEDQALIHRVTEVADVFISEPDNGIYDAMNKATALAHGDYVLYLNAGDELHPEFDWDTMCKQLSAPAPAMIWGVCHERYPEGELVKVKNRSPALSWYGMPVNHQNVLFQRHLLGNTPYNTNYQICADYDLICRILQQGGDVFRSSMPVSIFQKGGTNDRNFKQTMQEEADLRIKHFGMPRSVSNGIMQFKFLTSRISSSPRWRRHLRRWV